jgi:hypothetical protein
MLMKKTVLLLSVAAGLAFSGLLGRAADAPAATVDSVLAKSIEAQGGKAAMEKIKSRTVKARFEMPAMGVTSDWQMYSKAPNKQCSTFEVTGAGTMMEVCDGTNAWAKNSFEGVRAKKGDELAKALRDADFFRELHMKEVYPDLSLKGTETLDGEEVQVLQAKGGSAGSERFLYSTKTGLLIGQDSEFEGPQGKVKVKARMSDFRTVEGVKYPHQMKISAEAGGQTYDFVIKVSELQVNVPIDDAKFAKPSA